MKALKFIFLTALTQLVVVASAQATPSVDTLAVQGYMKKANGTAVSDGTYTVAFGVLQNGSVVWGKSVSTSIASGLFSANLSGAGSNLSAISASTGMNANYSAVTLNPALLTAGATGPLVVRVYAVTAIDGSNPQFDLPLASTPSAFVADTATRVVAGAITLTAIASTARATTSAGAADASKLVVLDSAGQIDISMIPTIPSTSISGQIPVANGGTGSATAAGSRTSLGAAASGANSDITSLSALSTPLSVPQGGSGASTAAGARTNFSAAASGANSDITSLSALSTALTTGQGGTGATTPSGARTNLGAAASGANSDITALSGLSTALTTAQGGTGATTPAAARTSLGVAASGANSDITSLSALSTALSAAQGGTGQSTYTTGDVVYASGASAISKLGIGSAGQVLTVNGGATAPQWSTPSPTASGSTTTILFNDFMSIHAAGVANITNTFVPMDDMVGFSSAATALVRNTAPSSTDVNHPGIMQLFSNAAGVAAGAAYCNVGSSAGAVTSGSMNFTGGVVTLEAVVRVPALGTGATYRVGFGSANVGVTTPTKKAYFEYVGAASGQWTYQAAGTGSTSANVGSTFAANQWMKLTITVDAAASSITFQKDSDTPVTQSTAANIPVATDLLCPFLANVGSAVSSRNLDVDYIKVTKTFSTPR